MQQEQGNPGRRAPVPEMERPNQQPQAVPRVPADQMQPANRQGAGEVMEDRDVVYNDLQDSFAGIDLRCWVCMNVFNPTTTLPIKLRCCGGLVCRNPCLTTLSTEMIPPGARRPPPGNHFCRRCRDGLIPDVACLLWPEEQNILDVTQMLLRNMQHEQRDRRRPPPAPPQEIQPRNPPAEMADLQLRPRAERRIVMPVVQPVQQQPRPVAQPPRRAARPSHSARSQPRNQPPAPATGQQQHPAMMQPQHPAQFMQQAPLAQMQMPNYQLAYPQQFMMQPTHFPTYQYGWMPQGQLQQAAPALAPRAPHGGHAEFNFGFGAAKASYTLPPPN